MTENMAARGEGLAELRERIIAAMKRAWPKTKIASYNGVILELEKLCREIALEAAAPAGTGRERSVESLENARRWCFSMRQDEWLGDAIQELQSWKPAALYRVVAALATPSPQAPQEQSNAFSPTELTHLRMATASGSPECICHIERLGNFGHYKRWRDKNCLVHGEKAKEGK